MQFDSYIFTNPDSGAQAEFFQPERIDPTWLDGPEQEAHIFIHGRPRTVLRALLGMAVTFESDPPRRTALRHDCSVFALACVTGDSQANIPFYQPGGYEVAYTNGRLMSPSQLLATQAHAPAGSVSITSDGDKPGALFEGSHHFMVRASTDEETPLCISKLSEAGCIALHTLPSIFAYYQAQSTITVDGLMRIPCST